MVPRRRGSRNRNRDRRVSSIVSSLKICIKCGIAQSYDAFHRNTKNRDGHEGACKVCRNSQKREDRAQKKLIANSLAEPPDGFNIKGTSTLYGPDGEIKAQWVKTDRERREQLEAFRKSCLKMAEPLIGLEPVRALPDLDFTTDRIVLYPMGDPHCGMFSWPKETGAPFDLEIFERNLYCAVDQLVQMAPATETAIIGHVGDYYHADSSKNETWKGTKVDVDSRHAKIVEIGLQTMRRCIARALEKHKRVIVFAIPGNHDTDSAMHMRITLSALFENDPRVEVISTPGRYMYHRFGLNLFGFTHGDTVKLEKLGMILATDRRADWGECRHFYWHTGHVHHKTIQELDGSVFVETHPTLASTDSWHHSKGYRTGRSMQHRS